MHPEPPLVGQTRDVGFEIGARRTLPLAPDAAWRLLLSPAGLACWLGAGAALPLTPGTRYALADGAIGEVRVYQPGSHLRLTWQPPGWVRPSTVQVRVLPSGERTTIAFHQEHLPDAAARAARSAYYSAALDGLERLIEETTP
ncbi:MAG: SRPBCC domain-containing protein [Chloroflexota bacterium]|nr:SRPBCC domain-containing protein [Chloroflexota bacterium]